MKQDKPPKIYHVETIKQTTDVQLQDYLNFMTAEGFELVSINGFNRPSINEKYQDYHAIWRLSKAKLKVRIKDDSTAQE